MGDVCIMKIKRILNRKNILVLIAFVILLIWALLFLRSMIAIESGYKYVFINDSIESEQIKSKIYIAANQCDSSYFEKIGNISKDDLKKYSTYSIKYIDEVLCPQNIELAEKDDFKIVLCTYNTNEAKRNKIVEFFESLNNYYVKYQQENTGILYCNDIDFLHEYCYNYGRGITYCDKLMVIPINDNVYFFVATRFVSPALLNSY